MNVKRNWADKVFKSIRDYWQDPQNNPGINDPNKENVWEEPPAEITVYGAKVTFDSKVRVVSSVTDTSKSIVKTIDHQELCAIQLYNGHGHVAKQKSKSSTVFTCENCAEYCMVFDSSAPKGSKWTYDPNTFGYVYKILDEAK